MLYKFSLYNHPLSSLHFTQQSSNLSNEEIDWIRDYGDKLEVTTVKLYGKFDERHVNAHGSHFPLNGDTEWIYKKMETIAHTMNSSSYRYDLTGFYENFYYLKYTAPGQHFNWHLDIGNQTPAPRKLSMTLQLSDPLEYDGGDFDVMMHHDHVTTDKEKGMVTAFPSYKIHRVTPVTRGIRRSLAMFVAGPNFR